MSQQMTLNQIRQIGIEALANKLGPVGMVRFLQQFETGQGDYSVDRHKWLTVPDVEMLVKQIRQKRAVHEEPPLPSA